MENKDIKIKQRIIPELVSKSFTLAVTQRARQLQAWKTLKQVQGLINKTQHQNIGQVLPDNKIDCHAERSLLSISTTLTSQGRDPEQKRLRMTTNFNLSPLTRRCAVLSPQGGQRTDRAFPARSVIPQACNAGYSGRSGFTLIELLVVVLIIGILAAIALPQYQKAVLKNKLSALKALVTPIANAAEFYYLQNGQYPSSFKDLDVSIPTPLRSEFYKPSAKNVCGGSTKLIYDWGWCQITEACLYSGSNPGRQELISCSYGTDKNRIAYAIYSPRTTWYPTGPACVGNTPLAIAVCQKETGATQPYYSNGATKDFSYSKKTKV